MPSSYTSLLGLVLPVQGELSGTWGDTVNNELTALVDSAVAGTTTLSTDADVTLTDTTGAANQARQIILNCTGARSVLRTITAPARSKAYIVINNTTGGFGVKIVGVGPTTGVTIANGTNAVVAWNGSDFEFVSSTSIADLTGTLPVANGGTGLTTLTANSVIVGNGTSTPLFVAPGSSGNVLTSDGTTWTSAILPAGGLTYVLKTANYTTQDKEGVLADTSGGAFTVTLPATPALGNQVVVADPTGDWGTNNLTVGRNGSTIAGVAQDLVCDISGASVQLVYDGTTWAVYAQVGGNGGTVVTLDGTQTLTNKTIEAGTFTNGYTEETALANTGATYTIDLANGTVQILTLTDNCTYTFPTPVAGKSFILVQKQDGTGGRSVTWPASVKWPGGTAPTITSTASKADKFIFTAIDGSSWLGSNGGQDYTV